MWQLKIYLLEEFEVYNFDFIVLLCDLSNYVEWNFIRVIIVYGIIV